MQLGGRDTAAFANSLSTMLNVQKTIPAKYQLLGWAAWLTGRNPCQHIIFAKPRDNQPSYSACPGPSANAFQLQQMGEKKDKTPQIKLFYAQLAAEELLSALSAFTSPLHLLVPDD